MDGERGENIVTEEIPLFNDNVTFHGAMELKNDMKEHIITDVKIIWNVMVWKKSVIISKAEEQEIKQREKRTEKT